MMDISRMMRLKIGDALVAPTGYRIDYIQPGDDMKECFMILHQNVALMIAPGAERKHAAAVLHFLHRLQLNNCLNLPVPGPEWHFEAGGSEDNPLWEYPIKPITVTDPQYFFRSSPHTNMLRTTATLAVSSNHEAVYENGRLIGVNITRQRGAYGVTTETDYFTSRVYELRPERGKLPISGFVRLKSIHQTMLGCLSREHLIGEGVATWHQFKALWERSANGTYRISKSVWVLAFERVYQVAPETASLTPTVRPPLILRTSETFTPRQLPLFAS